MTAAPVDLRARVLAAASEARPVGLSVPEPERISALQGLRRAAESFHELLRSLDADEWRRPVLRELDVQGLVGHLVGVEHDVQRALRGDASVADVDHVASTQTEADRQVGRAPEQTREDWCRALAGTLALADSIVPAGSVLRMHRMQLPVDDLLVVRAFELWTHENDIRRVTERPAIAPEPPTLRLMTQLAVQLLPHGARRVGAVASALDVHLVLTGAGGGTWDVALHAPDVQPDDELLLVLDAVDFCRLVADRVDPDDVVLQAGGATRHLDGVLAAAAALALD